MVGLLGATAGALVITVVSVAMFGRQHPEGGGPYGSRGGRASLTAATDNVLYRTGPLGPVQCRVPRIAAGGSESMRRFMHVLTGCLDASWRRQFTKAGLRFTPPRRVFWSRPGRSPCGSYPQPGAAAFYCPSNNAMYVGLRDIVDTAGNEPVSNYAVYARVISHEYGHHVQEEAGILAYGHQRMEGPAAAVRNDASRRIELQAQCFAGVFLGAERRTLPVTAGQYQAMIADISGRGDDHQPVDERDHGSSVHYVGWVQKGFHHPDLSVCNTWTAPRSTIS